MNGLMLKKVVKPLFLFLTIFAIAGFLVQIFIPNLYFVSQESAQNIIKTLAPYDVLVFIFLQIGQVILAPISHYVVGILGGFLYGAVMGGIYNWIGRVIGHIIAYWIGVTLGRIIIEKIFNPDDLHKFDKFINGTQKTFYIRIFILFAIIFLPFFPDDEISYLVGLAAFPFKWYILILLLGHLGGSFGLSYIGAGIDTKDMLFWIIFVSTLLLGISLGFAVRYFYKKNNEEKLQEGIHSA